MMENHDNDDEGIQNEAMGGNQENQGNEGAGDQGMENQDQNNPQPQDPKISWIERGAVVGTVGVVGAVAVFGGFAIIGLSTVGPVAGGWFAANMGAALVAGGPMATLQSAAMTAGTYVGGGVVGTVVGTIIPEKTIANGRDTIINSVAKGRNAVANFLNR
jgi:hypothetical protein